MLLKARLHFHVDQLEIEYATEAVKSPRTLQACAACMTLLLAVGCEEKKLE